MSVFAGSDPAPGPPQTAIFSQPLLSESPLAKPFRSRTHQVYAGYMHRQSTRAVPGIARHRRTRGQLTVREARRPPGPGPPPAGMWNDGIPPAHCFGSSRPTHAGFIQTPPSIPGESARTGARPHDRGSYPARTRAGAARRLRLSPRRPHWPLRPSRWLVASARHQLGRLAPSPIRPRADPLVRVQTRVRTAPAVPGPRLTPRSDTEDCDTTTHRTAHRTLAHSCTGRNPANRNATP